MYYNMLFLFCFLYKQLYFNLIFKIYIRFDLFVYTYIII
jgi:hypothetical protein